jgi:hypothetical protein
LPAARVARFRKERALSPSDVALVVTESIVPPGTQLDIRASELSFGVTIHKMLCATPMDVAR